MKRIKLFLFSKRLFIVFYKLAQYIDYSWQSIVTVWYVDFIFIPGKFLLSALISSVCSYGTLYFQEPLHSLLMLEFSDLVALNSINIFFELFFNNQVSSTKTMIELLSAWISANLTSVQDFWINIENSAGQGTLFRLHDGLGKGKATV